MVVLIDAAIEALLTKGAPQTLTLGGKTVIYYSLTDLRAARQEYAGLARAQELATGTKKPLRMFILRLGRAR